MGQILGAAPTWVYGLLAVLVVLGVRRLRTREVPIAVALLPALVFLVWSIAGALFFAEAAGTGTAFLAWFGGASLGALSAVAVPEPRGLRVAGQRVSLPGSWLPLVSYMIVFVARFACGTWAAISPGQAHLANGVSIAIGAVMTARLVLAVARWRTAGPGVHAD